MGRNTKMKLAALATTLVATVGIVAASPATSASAGNGGQTTSQFRGIEGCC
jgi:hypothetical protein